MKRIFAVLAAGLCMCPLLSAPVSAETQNMTFELTADRQTVFTDELQDGGATVHGKFYIRNYNENCTAVRTVLISDAPLEIVNGKLTQPYFFDDCFFRAYTQQGVNPDDKNIVVWNGPSDLEVGIVPMKIAEPEGSFAEFDIFIPADTKPGEYEIGFRNGVTTDANGGSINDTYAQSFTDDIELTLTGCKIVVAASAVRGDMDGNGKLQINDAVMLQRYVTEDLTAEEAAALNVTDLDGDGELTILDVGVLLDLIAQESANA